MVCCPVINPPDMFQLHHAGNVHFTSGQPWWCQPGPGPWPEPWPGPWLWPLQGMTTTMTWSCQWCYRTVTRPYRQLDRSLRYIHRDWRLCRCVRWSHRLVSLCVPQLPDQKEWIDQICCHRRNLLSSTRLTTSRKINIRPRVYFIADTSIGLVERVRRNELFLLLRIWRNERPSSCECFAKSQ